MIRIYNVKIPITGGEKGLLDAVIELLGVEPSHVEALKIVKRSLDARRERPPEYNYVVDLGLHDEQEILKRLGGNIRYDVITEEKRKVLPVALNLPVKKIPVIVGSGPAGLFAALTLARQGVPALILERGKRVEERVRDIQAFWDRGMFNAESNVHFGEGGAGTFSDGKLTTRMKDGKIGQVKKIMVDLGAPEEILVNAKPHIGTDKLRFMLINFRELLLRLGCQIAFGSKVTDISIVNGKITGVVVNGIREIETDHLIWAAGQSSPCSYELLQRKNVALAPKAFAMGVRVEQPQELIDRIQYGKWWKHETLPPAEYVLTAKLENMGRSVYTFCMCPGGRVIACSSDAGTIVTNGMSNYARDGAFANSAVVVNIRPDDFPDKSPLAGLEFRKTWETLAFDTGGKNYFAPAQKLTDFISGIKNENGCRTTYRPGVKTISLDHVLPGFVTDALRRGFLEFERKMPGFVTQEAVLIGVETRTSSPVRILRNPNAMSANTDGLYPCGEGSGYAGGIISSAVDGIRVAEKILSSGFGV